MLLIIFALLLAAFANANYRLSGSILYPPTLLCAVWSLFLVGLLATSHIFSPISVETLTVYLIGAGAFSIGALCVSFLFARTSADSAPKVRRQPSAWVLTGGLILLLAALPMYWGYIQSLDQSAGSDNFWRSVRVEQIDRADNWSAKTLGSLLLEGFSVLSTLLAITAVAEHDGSRFSRIRMGLIVLAAFVYALMAAASSGAVILGLGLIGVDAIRKRKLDMKVLSLGACGIVASFAVIALVLDKGKMGLDATFTENLSGLVELAGVYMLSGVVAFDTVVQYPASVPPVWSIWRAFQLTANKFGAQYEVPALHAQYTNVSNDYEGNVYTIYFAYYPDYGLAGVVVIMLVLGAVLTCIYEKARRGCARSILLYALVFAGIVLTGFSELFFLSANFWFKAVIFAAAIYGVRTSAGAPI